MKLIDERTEDGSRCFAQLTLAVGWEDVCKHLLTLPGAELTTPLSDEPRGQFTLRYGGHQFRADYRHGELSLVVCDPLCSDLLLFQIMHHLAKASTV
jgi:hypothetical protein